MQDSKHILDLIEQENFLLQTYIASSHSLVKRILVQTPEVIALLQQRAESLPTMHFRYRSLHNSLPDHARLVYFVIFGLARDQEMVSDILAYLRECLTLPPGTWQFPWHPFFYGANALAEILEDPSSFDLSAPTTHPEAFIAHMEQRFRDKLTH